MAAPFFGVSRPLTPHYASFKFPRLSNGGAEASVAPGRIRAEWRFFCLLFSSSNLGRYAYHQPTRSQGTSRASEEEQVPCIAEEPSKKGRLHTGVHDHSEEAELGVEEGGSGTSDERVRGDVVHPGRGAQSPGALDRAHARRAGEGPTRCSVPHRERNTGRVGRE